jgi:hypothetical protein
VPKSRLQRQRSRCRRAITLAVTDRYVGITGIPDSIYAMFHVVILVHALESGWHDIYRVGTEFQSFKLCEVARTDLANDFKEFLERRHSEPVQVQSKCVNLNDER